MSDRAAVAPTIRRFSGLPPAASFGVLAALVALIALGLFAPRPPPSLTPPGGVTDFALYGRIIDLVRHHVPYEKAAVDQLRAAHWAVRPFVTVRPPLLAVALARLPGDAWGDRLMSLLSVTVIAAWAWRLRKESQGPLRAAVIGALMYTSVAVTFTGVAWSRFHETWAGLLIALSLTLRSERRFAASVVLGLLAALIRELAMPYLAVMAAIALAERRRAEAGAFAAALAAALVALAWHAQAESALTAPTDTLSPSWLTLGGWGMVMTEAQWNLITLLAGQWTAAVLLPLGLLGAAGRRDGLGLRLTALLTGYVLGFMVVGRPGAIYWGLMITPLIGFGLCLAPAALADLSRGAAARARS